VKALIRGMRNLVVCLCLTAGGLDGGVLAGEVSEFELTDGTMIRGEIIAYSKGVYTIQSSSIGTVKIDETKIQVIRVKSDSSPTRELSSASLSREAQALQQLLLGDEQLLTNVLSLQDDPEVQAILQDPDMVRAANSGSIDALISNPKFMRLLLNPKIQAITREVFEQMSQTAE